MNPSVIVPAHPRADLATRELVGTLRSLDGALREATLDVYGAVGLTNLRDLSWQVSDSEALVGRAQPPLYVQNLKRGETIPVYQTEEELRLIRDRSRILCFYNEFALCGIENRKNYVVGEDGLKYSAQPCKGYRHDERAKRCAREVQEFVDLFVEVNDLHEMEAEVVHRWDEEGEAAIRLFDGEDDIPEARFVEPEHIRAPNGDNWAPELSFGVETDPHDIKNVKAYHIVENPLEDAWTPVRVPESEVCHSTLNVKSVSKRGLPTFFPVETNLRRCEDLLASLTSMAKARAKIALIRTLTGSTSDVAANMLRNLASIRVTDPVTAEELNVERYRYGTILTTGQNGKYEFPPGNVSGAEYVEVLQAELRAVAARLQMPEWMFTALADAKYSNAFVVEAPTKKSFSKLQRKLCRFMAEYKTGPRRSLLWRAVAMAVRAGLLDEACLTLVDITAKGPSLEARDKAQEASGNQTYAEMGIKSDDTIRDELGLDAETEDSNLAEQRERKRKEGRKELAKDVLQIQKDYFAGAIPRPAACALLESLDFTREEAEALLPLAAGVDRTAQGRQQAQQQQQQAQMAAMGGAPGGPGGEDGEDGDDENPLAALAGPDPDQGGPSDAPPGPSPSGAPGGGATPLAERWFEIDGDANDGLGLRESYTGYVKGGEVLALLEAGFTGTVTASNGAVFYYVDGKRVRNPYAKNAQGAAKPLASHHAHEVAKAHQSRAQEAAKLAHEYPEGLTPAHMEALAVKMAVLPTHELRDIAKKLGAKVKGKLKDDVVTAVVKMFPMPVDGKVPELPEAAAPGEDEKGVPTVLGNSAITGDGAGSSDLKSGQGAPAPSPDTLDADDLKGVAQMLAAGVASGKIADGIGFKSAAEAAAGKSLSKAELDEVAKGLGKADWGTLLNQTSGKQFKDFKGDLAAKAKQLAADQVEITGEAPAGAPDDAEAMDKAFGPATASPPDEEPASEEPATPGGLSETAQEHAAALVAIIEHNKKLKKNHAYIANKVEKYAQKNMSAEDMEAISSHTGVGPDDALHQNINKLHAALKGAGEGAPAQPKAEATPFADVQFAPETPAATAKVEEPAALAVSSPSLPTAPPEGFPKAADLGGLKTVGKLGGSTGAEKVEHNGKQYVKKSGASAAHVREEHLADTLYKIAGARTPAGQLYDQGGTKVKLTEFIDGKPLAHVTGKQREAAHAEVRKHFVADALFGNWDVIGQGGDNVLVGDDGEIYRIDNGGSLRFRAQGGDKGSHFGPTVNELDTMRSPSVNKDSAEVFGKLTDAEIKGQIADILSKRDAILGAVSDAGLRDTLSKRMDYLAGYAKKEAPPAGGKKLVHAGGEHYVVPKFAASKLNSSYNGDGSVMVSKGAPKESQTYLNHIDEDGVKAVEAYTNGKYRALNKALYSGEALAGANKTIDKRLQSVFAHAEPLKEPITVHRGTNMSGSELADFLDFAQRAQQAGEAVPWRNYQSTGSVKEKGWKGNVNFTIQGVKHGAIDVAPISNHPGESEILLNRGLKFKILSVENQGTEAYPKYHVTMEHVG